MTPAWMAYALVAATLVAGAAQALDSGAQLLRLSRRWIWLAALGGTLVLVAAAPLRARHVAQSPVPGVGAPPIVRTPETRLGAAPSFASAPAASTTPHSSLEDRANGIRSAAESALLFPMALVEPYQTSALSAWLLTLWVASSLAVLALLCAVQLRFIRARRAWPRSELDGLSVRIAPESGPAVIGLYPAEIVVPRWLTLRSNDERRLVLAHEHEHVRAGDPFALAAAWMAVVLLPWNPAIWWMAAKLRLAVELDCDMRVIRQGVVPSRYGTLLIDLAAHCTGLGIGAAAFSDHATQLEHRLKAITPSNHSFAGPRAAALGMLASVAIGVACTSRLPAAADERYLSRPPTGHLQSISTSTVFILNGSRVTADRALSASLSDRLEKLSYGCTRVDPAGLAANCALVADSEVSPRQFAIPLPKGGSLMASLQFEWVPFESCTKVTATCIEVGIAQDSMTESRVTDADSAGSVDTTLRARRQRAVVRAASRAQWVIAESLWVAIPFNHASANHGSPVYMIDGVIVTEAAARALLESPRPNITDVELLPPAQVINLKLGAPSVAETNGLVHITTTRRDGHR